jgi:peptidoglycan/xylan/chitin deacetylase (PgdA/CDA1 family)
MILMYHNINLRTGFNTVALNNFIQQIKFLQRQDYRIISLQSYVEHIKTRRPINNNLVITFDDAYIGFMEHAFPILKEFNIPATLFVPTKFVGGYNEWDQHLTDERLPVMTWTALKKVSSELVTIGSHGHSHRSLSTLAKNEIDFEVCESKRLIKENIGIGIEYFSYPYGQHKHFNDMVIETLKKAEYKAACSTNWHKFNSTGSLFKLNRLEIEPEDTLESFSKKINKNFHIKYFKQVVKNILSPLK